MSAMMISHEDFVVAYVTAHTLDDVVKATGMKRAAIQQRAYMLRKKGVRLPRLSFPTVLDQFAIARLNSLVNKHDIRKKRAN